MSTTPTDLLATLNRRYATKQFDAQRSIAPELWQTLLSSLVLTPSSYGLQPWKFLVIDTPAVRQELRTASWNQSQVTDAARFVVFIARTTITEADIAKLISATSTTRGVPAAALAGYAGVITGDLVNGPRSQWIPEWAARQAYIALGQFMLAAAELGLDTCPMEGLDPAAYDRILGLAGSGYRTVVACPVGYRSPADKYATLPKVRYAQDEVIEVR
jgi:nitroreductase